ncbi:MAG: 3-deoxy-D-manno-octulosonic acid transferase [Candidatus Omnitrophota bacterium]|nr:3-deoxy-D-manno-octulosonic acid transferase [Candidatus Omnitrophota bacterium]
MLYDIAFFIFSIFYLPALIFKGKLHRDFCERFGLYDKSKRESLATGQGTIWIQAVSVGEVALCKSLIPALKEKFPGLQIVFSTITKTGNALAKKLFSKDAVIIYFPLDFSFVVNRCVNLLNPRIYVMIETEIWPNLLNALSGKGARSILINGRISDRSFGKYKLVRRFLRPTLEKINSFCMQSELDAERIKFLGAPAQKVNVTGNMKFDSVVAADTEITQSLRSLLGLESCEELLVAGSTHRGEEELMISVFKELAGSNPKLNLLIAPRHIERSGEVEALARSKGFVAVRVSTLSLSPPSDPGPRIFILDTIGQLKDVYLIGTLVFVGGSLVKHGGQNPIEPAVLGRPVIFGPHMFNFRDIARILLDNAAAIQVFDNEELLDRVRFLLSDKEKAAALGRNAKRAVLNNRGATARNLEAIGQSIAFYSSKLKAES